MDPTILKWAEERRLEAAGLLLDAQTAYEIACADLKSIRQGEPDVLTTKRYFDWLAHQPKTGVQP